MNKLTSVHSDQVKWVEFLIRFLGDAEVAALQDLVEQQALSAPTGATPEGQGGTNAAHSHHSTSGRLLAFYIERAQKRSADSQPEVRAVAQRELEKIRSQLAERAAAPTCISAAPLSAGPVAQNRSDQPADAVDPAPAAFDMADPALADAIRLAYRLVLKRGAVDEEVAIWKENFANGLQFHEFLLALHEGDEARAVIEAGRVDVGSSDGVFVRDLYRIVEGRGCNGYELDAMRRRLETGAATRQELLVEFFARALEQDRSKADEMVHDGLSCLIMGTQNFITLDDWQRKAEDKERLGRAHAALRPARPFVLRAEPGIRVSAIASLYCGGDFIEQFMDNIASQTCFDRYCELIIVDADSPENESEIIARYLDRYPNINYQRMNSRIGIYEAWNEGVRLARGMYLTNTNLDDLRREDSLEIQAGTLDALPFVDVVYQDFYYSFDPQLTWAEVAAFDYKSDLPLVTPHNMLRFNSPHNAPMWRKTLHDELGLFDANFKSAGDYEFWLRCLAVGKTFYKINEPHVVYYQNPKGLSTRADTRGVVEAKAVGQKYAPMLLPEPLVCDFDEFVVERLKSTAPTERFADRDRHVAVQYELRDLARRFKQEKV